MRAMIGGVAIAVVFGCCAGAAAGLRPKVLADKLLIQAEQLFENKDYDAALKLLEKIVALQKENQIKLREEFHFKHAQIAYSAGLIGTAIDALHEYLAPESEGEFYKDALILLIKAEDELEAVAIAPAETCAGRSDGTACWMALDNHPGCYVWNPNPQENEIVSWSGNCIGSVARGMGTITWAIADGDSLRESGTSTGRLLKGKMNGQWVNRSRGESVPRFPLNRDGWFRTFSVGEYVEEGPVVNGKPHGQWLQRWPDGYREKGEFIDGQKEGEWIAYLSERHRELEPGCYSRTYFRGRWTGQSSVESAMCQW